MIFVTPQGTLALNDDEQVEGLYALDTENCKSGPTTRATADNVPQGDGAILHAGFFGGYGLDLTIQYWAKEDVAACATSDPSSESMNDLMMRHLAAIISGGGRLLYTPEGKATRLLDRLQLEGTIVVTEAPGATGVQFQLLSELPYTFDFEQTTTTLDAGTPTATLTNDGSIKYLPVIRVHGPFDGFTLENADALDAAGNPLQIVYDSGLPGAVPIGPAEYIEIITFANTVYLNGNGPSRKAGIDIVTSDFFPLVVGDNELTISGDGTGPVPTTDILWQAAWL